MDSPRAVMCWNSEWTEIQCSSLNGENPRTVHKLSLWSDDRITGTSIDPETHQLAFLVRSYGGDPEYRLHVLNLEEGGGATVSVVHALAKGRFSGPLLASNGKAHWLRNGTDLVHFDLVTMQIIATRRLGDRVMAFTAVEGSAAIERGDFSVIPAPVEEDGIKVLGDFGGFKVVWEHVENADYESVKYEVQLELPAANYTVRLSTSVPEFDPREHVLPADLLAPHAEMKVTILAKTKWAKAAAAAVAVILSPDDVSESPRNARAYFWPSGKDRVFEVRWDPPANPNGVIVGYRVSVTCEGFGICGRNVKTTGAEELSTKFRVTSLRGGSVRFGVSAVNSRGKGDSATVSATIESKYALQTPSRVIAYHSQTRGLKVVDIGAKTVEVGEMYVGEEVRAAAYSELDQAFYYLTAEGTVTKLSQQPPFREHLASITHATDLAYDFFARVAYVLKSSGQKSAVYRIAVDEPPPSNEDIVAELDGHVSQIALDPYFSSRLYFASESEVSVWDLEAGKMLARNGDSACNCGAVFDAARGKQQVSFALRNGGRIGSVRVVIGLASGETLAMYEADEKLCSCASFGQVNGTRASVLAADAAYVYLTNNLVVDNSGRIADIGDVRAIASFCPEYQSMPEPHCLRPRASDRGIEAVNVTDTTVTVQFPKITKSSDCHFANTVPPTNYTVQFGEMREDERNLLALCDQKRGHCGTASKMDYGSTFESGSSVTLTDLKPNSRYGLLLHLSNVYSGGGDAVKPSSVKIVRTLEGQPSKPRNVTAEILTPTSMRVRWLPSEVKNADSVTYTVFYQTSKSVAATLNDPPHRGYVQNVLDLICCFSG